MKVCRKCGLEKDLSEFYKKPNMADGHLNHCITCVKAYEKERRLKVADHLKAYEKARMNLPHRVQARKEYMQTEQGKAAHKKALDAYRDRFPIKRAAHMIFGNAVKRGKVTRAGSCSECGSTEKIEGHHDDYTKPLDVRWLCEKCHKEWHKHNDPIYE
jgi:ribosomal protein S27AE